MRCSSRYFLNASLTFSPACLRLALVWSAWPSPVRRGSFVALPCCSLALPAAWSFLFRSLSKKPIALILSPPCTDLPRRRYLNQRERIEPPAAVRAGSRTCLRSTEVPVSVAQQTL